MRVVRKGILSAASLVLFILFTPTYILHGLWAKFILRNNTCINFSMIKEAYAVVLSSIEDALKTLLADAQNIDTEIKALSDTQKKIIEEKAGIKFDNDLDKEYKVHIGKSDSKIVGYVIEDTVKGKWGPMHYALSLTPDGTVADVMVLEYQERRGRPVAERRFLDQFRGKALNNELKLKKDIKGVAGATISSKGMTDGIRKLVHIFGEFYGTKE